MPEDLIFLCHAKEDAEVVSNVYCRLREAGFSPWMDKPPAPYQTEGIPPGADWDAEIRRRIKDATVFLAFFSKSSTDKRGYVQKEFRFALSARAELPQDSSYLVPVLLEEDCEIPDITVDTVNLRSFQWFNYCTDGTDGLITMLSGKWGVRAKREISKKEIPTLFLREVAKGHIMAEKIATYNKIDHVKIAELRHQLYHLLDLQLQKIDRIAEEIGVMFSSDVYDKANIICKGARLFWLLPKIKRDAMIPSDHGGVPPYLHFQSMMDRNLKRDFLVAVKNDLA